VVTFEDVGGGQTSVQLSLEYEPEGLLEKVGDKLNIVEKQAEGDLDRFKAFIESERYASGAWRGSVNEGAEVGTPGVEEAAASRGDAGKAGVSGAAVAAGAAAAVAGGVAAAAVKKNADEPQGSDQPVDRPRVNVGEPLEATPAAETTLPAESADPAVADLDTTRLGTSATDYTDAPLAGEDPRKSNPLGDTPPSR